MREHLGDVVSALVDGELDPDEAAGAERHLRSCPACAAEVRSTEAVRALVRSLPAVEPPVPLVPLVPVIPARQKARPSVARLPAWAAAAAAAVLAFLVLPAASPERPVAPPLASLVQLHEASVALVAAPELAPATVQAAVAGGPPPASSPAALSTVGGSLDASPAVLDGAPASLPGGYRLAGAHRRGAREHRVYVNAGSAVSVFTEAGELDRAALPAGGEVVAVGDAHAVRYRTRGGEVLTWSAGDAVHTVVGRVPLEDLVALAAALPAQERPAGAGAHLRRVARRVAEMVTGGWLR